MILPYGGGVFLFCRFDESVPLNRLEQWMPLLQWFLLQAFEVARCLVPLPASPVRDSLLILNENAKTTFFHSWKTPTLELDLTIKEPSYSHDSPSAGSTFAAGWRKAENYFASLFALWESTGQSESPKDQFYKKRLEKLNPTAFHIARMMFDQNKPESYWEP